MILVDTTVVIDFTRGKDAKLNALVTALNVAICGLTRSEVLQGSRSATDRAKLHTELAAFQYIPIPEPLWDTVGDNLAALRSKGITVPLADAVIATLGLENDVEVWSRDPHFPLMQTVLPRLKLFVEPP